MSFEELLKELKNPQKYPRCLIINEIGCLCLGQNAEEKKKAEKVLRELLKNKQDKNRDIIFACLSVISNPDKETTTVLEEFRKDPSNREIIEEMEPQIARFKILSG